MTPESWAEISKGGIGLVVSLGMIWLGHQFLANLHAENLSNHQSEIQVIHALEESAAAQMVHAAASNRMAESFEALVRTYSGK